MSRRSHSLDSDAYGSAFLGEEADPMASVANIADAMLVFACGLMAALVAFWNLDISPTITEVDEDSLVEVANMQQMAEDMEGGGSGYSELGVVYQDPLTGEMYMVIPSAEEGGASLTVPVEERVDVDSTVQVTGE